MSGLIRAKLRVYTLGPAFLHIPILLAVWFYTASQVFSRGAKTDTASSRADAVSLYVASTVEHLIVPFEF